MKNKLLVLLISLLAFLFMASPAAAVSQFSPSVTDRNSYDLNEITGTDYEVDPNVHTNATFTIYENYGENDLIVYPSHDGMGVVNLNGDEIKYFDKQLDFSDIVDIVGAISSLTLSFEVTNTGTYTWSDYHFEFWDADFQNRLDITDYLSYDLTSTIFQNSDYDDVNSILSYYASEYVDPGETDTYFLYLDIASLYADLGITEIGIRQIATTSVPVPSSILMMGIGLLALVQTKRKNK